eukprot:scaffold70208_cov45-Phaeocystis_antarctica.AAC.1
MAIHATAMLAMAILAMANLAMAILTMAILAMAVSISFSIQVLGLGPKPCDVESLDVVQQATLAIQKAVQRYDGAITRLITDDKGTRFLIAFGLPGHQHDHDEERAVLSSLEVVAALDAIPAWTDEGEEEGSNGSLQVAVGITTGLVFCGEAGWVRNRVEYTLAGAK